MPIENETPEVPFETVKRQILDQIAELLEANHEKFHALAMSADDRKVNLSIPVKLDYSQTQITGEVDISYGKRYTDKRTFTVGEPDPEQAKLTPILEEATRPKRKKRGGDTIENDDGNPANN